MSTSEKKDPGALRYGEAMAELKQILHQVEDEGVDLDDLSAQVERAAELIRACRQKIQETEVRVRRVLEDLEGDP